MLGRDLGELKQIVLHLGNGASASAVRGGSAVETSMGLTPLEGLVMGTRSGDVDPGVVFHLLRNAGMDVDEVDNLLNRRSGMLGLSGVNDFRDLHKLIDAGRRATRRWPWTCTATGSASTSAPISRCWAAPTSSRSPPASGRTTPSSGRRS